MNSPKKPIVVIQTYDERQPLKTNSDITQKNNVFPKAEVHKVRSTSQKGPSGPPAPPPLPPSVPTAAKPFLTNGADDTDMSKNNNQASIPDRKPSTPTPDYDTSTLEKSFTNKTFTNGNKESPPEETTRAMKVDIPAPPATILKSPQTPNEQSLQHGTLKKSMRPISITIGEYPSNITRKEPSKLDFLADSKSADNNTESEPIGCRLQSELVKTLSRSNLKKKTDALDLKLSQKMDNLIMDNRNFHMRYPNTGVIMSPPSITIPKITAKTVNSINKVNINKDSLEESLANLRKLKEFNANSENEKDVNVVNLQTLLPNFHQVTMVIKDSHTSPGN